MSQGSDTLSVRPHSLGGLIQSHLVSAIFVLATPKLYPRPTPFPPIPTANSMSQLGWHRQLPLASAQFIISAKHMQTLSTPVATAPVQSAVTLTWIPAPTFAPQPTEFSQLKLQSDHRPTLF